MSEHIQTNQTPLDREIENRGFRPGFIADKAGVTLQTLRKYRLGITSPDIDTARKIAEAIGCTIEELFPASEVTANA